MSGTREGALKAAHTKEENRHGECGLADLIEIVPPGECLFCSKPATPRSTGYDAVRYRQRTGAREFNLTCGEYACRVTAYQRAYGRDRRAKNSTRFEVSRGGVTPHPQPSFR